MESLTAARAQQHANSVARKLEQRLTTGDPADLDLIVDVHDLEAHRDGALSIVLDVQGPYVALVLGRERPHIEVWWGGSEARADIALNAADVATFVETWWRPLIAASMTARGG